MEESSPKTRSADWTTIAIAAVFAMSAVVAVLVLVPALAHQPEASGDGTLPHVSTGRPNLLDQLVLVLIPLVAIGSGILMSLRLWDRLVGGRLVSLEERVDGLERAPADSMSMTTHSGDSVDDLERVESMVKRLQELSTHNQRDARVEVLYRRIESIEAQRRTAVERAARPIVSPDGQAEILKLQTELINNVLILLSDYTLTLALKGK